MNLKEFLDFSGVPKIRHYFCEFDDGSIFHRFQFCFFLVFLGRKVILPNCFIWSQIISKSVKNTKFDQLVYLDTNSIFKFKCVLTGIIATQCSAVCTSSSSCSFPLFPIRFVFILCVCLSAQSFKLL